MTTALKLRSLAERDVRPHLLIGSPGRQSVNV
jgi:hypothetical protein